MRKDIDVEKLVILSEERAISEYTDRGAKTVHGLMYQKHNHSSPTEDMWIDEQMRKSPKLKALGLEVFLHDGARWGVKALLNRQSSQLASSFIEAEARRRAAAVEARRKLLTTLRTIEAASSTFRQLGLGSVAKEAHGVGLVFHLADSSVGLLRITAEHAAEFSKRYGGLEGLVRFDGDGWVNWLFDASSVPNATGKGIGLECQVYIRSMNQAGTVGESSGERVRVSLPIKLGNVQLDDIGRIPVLPADLARVVAVLPGSSGQAVDDVLLG